MAKSVSEGPEIKGIVFDKDGVLVDFEKTWIKVLIDMAEELSEKDLNLKGLLLDLAGYVVEPQGFLSGSIWAAGTTTDLVDVWSRELLGYSRDQLLDFINTSCLDVKAVPLHGIKPLQKMFDELRAFDLNLGIATNDLEQAAVKTMQEFGLDAQLSLVCGYDSVENPKPAPDPVFAFCKETGLEPDNIAVVGDNVHDLEMAENARARLAIGVLSGNSTLEELAPHADFVLESVLDLPRLLQQEIFNS